MRHTITADSKQALEKEVVHFLGLQSKRDEWHVVYLCNCTALLISTRPICDGNDEEKRPMIYDSAPK